MNNKTYFGIDIYPEGIKVDDIVMIPYDAYFDEVSTEIDGVKYIDLLTWKTYAKKYIYDHKLHFPKGVYVSEYTFGETEDINLDTYDNIFIESEDALSELEETRHVKFKDN